ncbi:MAG: hypothetical protein AB7E72_18265 [Lysobacterales bacterium]
MSFLSELKRRNVIRMAGLYLVGAWLIVQVAETVLPAFEVPGWVLRAIIIVLAIGFVPALVVSWVFELTPEGLKRESEMDPSASRVDRTARKLDVAVIVLLLAVGGMLLWQWQMRAPTAATAPSSPEPLAGETPPAAESITDKSIAVLPFADFSQDGDQGWFADGLAEEILNALARTPDLLVSARTSSFKYKGSELAIPQIAAELGVAHVLEGSVRSTPQRIRVTAQLIRAADGFHLWSQTYDRDVADMIEIQEDLALQIATAMQTSMDPAALAEMARVGTRSIEAYQAYMRGVAMPVLSGAKAFKEGYEQFELARALDPTFAEAHRRAANFWLVQLDPTRTASGQVDESPAQMVEQFRARIDAAIQYSANEVDRLSSRSLKAQLNLRFREAVELEKSVLAARPTDRDAVTALLDMSGRLSDQGLFEDTLAQAWAHAFERRELATAHLNYAHRGRDKSKAADQALQLLERWPEDDAMLYQAHRALLWDGRVEQARAVLTRWQQLQSSSPQWSALPPARQACAEGRRADVERALRDDVPLSDVSQRWHLLMLLGRKAEAANALMPLEQSGNTYALAGFLTYVQFDPSPFPSLLQLLEREHIVRPPPVELPFACPPLKDGP